MAPRSRVDEGVFSEYVNTDSIRDVVRRRVSEYREPEKDLWFEDRFLPTLEVANLRCISWEEILAVISEHKEDDGQSLSEFYATCLEFNRPVAGPYAR